MSDPDQHAVYPIRTVAELTGINPVTLRAWERRYGLIRPQRTEKGHRLYTEADIQRIRHIVALLDRGILISRAREILANDPEPEDTTLTQESDPWPAWQQRLDGALARFEPAALDGALGELLSLYPVDRAAAHVLIPTLESRLAGNHEAAAEGQLLAVYLRGRLGHLINRTQPHGHGLRLLLATPADGGEATATATIRQIVFGLTALALGHRPTLLGEDVPAGAIIAGARRARADRVILHGGTRPGAQWQRTVAAVAAAWPEQLAIAGPAADSPAFLPPEATRLSGDPQQACRYLDRMPDNSQGEA